ncbi:HamA C-terminal domain-containing protein [Ectopseudomonas toyotomiensis]|uniref:HamA C-terminal domain-containing protein n=1 Tax=Ectopseudomonas toyotomiensis TaxID=554344 RepID=UPI003D0C965B
MPSKIKELEHERKLQQSLNAILRDHSRFKTRIKIIEKPIEINNELLNIRLSYPAFRQGRPTVSEMLNTVVLMLTHFCLPKSEIKSVMEKFSGTDDYDIEINALFMRAKNLFKRAHEITNRNGEAGELILYILTEWILEAPQILAKMSLKTNPQMPVHGSDGVHAKYCNQTGRLYFYWGESKLYADISSAIASAAKSLSDAFSDSSMMHEIELVKRNLDLSGLDETSKQEFLKFLDPFDESYNERHDIATCLIGFDFEKYNEIHASSNAESQFIEMANLELNEAGPKILKALEKQGISDRYIELFILPLPSVQEFRDSFQDLIGWGRP